MSLEYSSAHPVLPVNGCRSLLFFVHLFAMSLLGEVIQPTLFGATYSSILHSQNFVLLRGEQSFLGGIRWCWIASVARLAMFYNCDSFSLNVEMPGWVQRSIRRTPRSIES
jgi:hypothetical protein